MRLQTGVNTVARPRKADGRPMPKNMYILPGYSKLPPEQQRFRYKLENGKFKSIKNSSGVLAPYDEAVQIAEAANRHRKSISTSSSLSSLPYWLNQYIIFSEEQNPRLESKPYWRQSKSAMQAFAKLFAHIKTNHLQVNDLESWWYSLTYDQQHNRRAVFSKWFVFMMNKGAVKVNPFATSEDRPHLIHKPKPEKKRLPLEIDDFWCVYRSAGELGLDDVQIAMGIALVTMMRESDICGLTFDDHIVNNHLRKSIEKSINQRGSVGASHLDFDLSVHALLSKLVKRARELSMKHQRCPYLLSYQPKQKRLGKTKTHTHQVTTDLLQKRFAMARDATGIWQDLPEGTTPPSFHEIKGLAINEAKKHAKAKGYSKEDISNQAAHTDGRVTDGYNANHDPVWSDARVSFDIDMVGGEF